MLFNSNALAYSPVVVCLSEPIQSEFAVHKIEQVTPPHGPPSSAAPERAATPMIRTSRLVPGLLRCNPHCRFTHSLLSAAHGKDWPFQYLGRCRSQTSSSPFGSGRNRKRRSSPFHFGSNLGRSDQNCNLCSRLNSATQYGR